MLFWTLSIALALIVALALARGYLRAEGAATPTAAYDLQVFRDQLQEVERDAARGVIGAEDAARLRTEIGRRLLEADRSLRLAAPEIRGPRGMGRIAGVAAALLIAGSFFLYWQIGAPGFSDQPLSRRLALAEADYAARPAQAQAEAAAAAQQPAPPQPDAETAALMQKLRDTVAERPGDRQGLSLLARNEAALGNWQAAWQAQARLIAAKGDEATARDHATQAEMMIFAAGGVVTPEAEAQVAQALRLDPRNEAARYFLGLMFLQSGRPDRTFTLWRGLLEDGAPDAPWQGQIRAAMPDLAWLAGQEEYVPPAPGSGAGSTPASGPSAADMAAAAGMGPADREAMIRGMVEGLNDRLASEGGSSEDWARLISALAVLGETDRARAVWQEAEDLFAASPDDLQRVADAARAAGVAE
ncbi:c-type cytochrome biogenesis protein CcmI [Frigidibacter oleivorans]|uniref:c-type cytochrome biogenesis protein CcmI n=1 Tax=Frigidibacter oleivorans TaxID=2487129 RepID=UPI000F8E447A|nr:c-type cytochrome biogenesis protein CcmI [Frigidibacter oleivorans]